MSSSEGKKNIINQQTCPDDAQSIAAWLDAEQFAQQMPKVVQEQPLAIDALVTDGHFALYKSALRILGGREHSSYELAAKLRIKYPDASNGDIQLVIAALQEQEYQSDQRYTQQALKGLLRKGKGALFIKNKVAQAKPDAAVIGAFTAQLSDVDWYAGATLARIKRFGERLPCELDDKAKQYRFLLQRGFSVDVITAVLKNNFETTDELDAPTVD